MCCSYEIGQEFEVKFQKYFYYSEIDKYGNEEKFSFKTKDFSGKEITDYYVGYPVCKFSGKVLRVEQNFENGGSPYMIGVNSQIDLLYTDNTGENYHIKNIFSEVKLIGKNYNILNGKIPHVGEEIYGILIKGYYFKEVGILKYYQNEEEFLKKDTEIPFCQRQEKIGEKNKEKFITQISEKNFEENKSFETYFHFLYIFIIFVIGFLVYKKCHCRK